MATSIVSPLPGGSSIADEEVIREDVSSFVANIRNEAGRKPAFISRKDFHLLSFPEDTPYHERTQWKNKYQHQLANEVSMPNSKHWHFKNIYVSRKYPKIIEDLKNGIYGKIAFICKDRPPSEKSPRYREFIIRGFPNIWDLDELYEILGDITKDVHKFHRIKFRGKNTDSVKMVWKNANEDPPLQLSLFPDMPITDSPVLDFQEMEPRPPKMLHL